MAGVPLSSFTFSKSRNTRAISSTSRPVSTSKTKSHYVDEIEWTIFENTHTLIINQKPFDKVQRIRWNIRCYPDGWGKAAPLTGLMYCANCGGKMYVHRSKMANVSIGTLVLSTAKSPLGALCPAQHRINESVVFDLIFGMFRAIADHAKSDRAAFIR